jgi:uncharacterized protein YecE (DUF72 family)
MDFGRVDNPDEIDFTLPPDDRLTEDLFDSLKGVKTNPLQLYVGCTSWGRKDWIGKLYPRGAKDKDLLGYYVKQFNTIELNALFYNLQPKQVIEKWASLARAASFAAGSVSQENSPRKHEFRFCPKFSNTISHIQQLKNVVLDTDRFLDHMLHFGENLGPSFLQLSDNFAPNRATVIQDYVRQLPRDFKVCVELRHADWFREGVRAGRSGESGGNAVSDTWRLLQELGIGTVITDTSGRRDCLHMKLTTPVAFIRFVSNNMHPTDFLRLDAWAERINTWAGKGLREVYFFIHSHDEFYAPDLCKYAVEQFNKTCGTDLKPPVLSDIGVGGNLSLF